MSKSLRLAAIGLESSFGRVYLQSSLATQVTQLSRPYVNNQRQFFSSTSVLSFTTKTGPIPSTISKMTDTDDPTAEQATKLFQDLEQKFPSKNLGEERWYLIAVRLSHPPINPSPGSNSLPPLPSCPP